MIDHLHHRGWHYALLSTLAGVMFFANLGGASLWDVDEGRNSTCMSEMKESGNWIVPTFNGKLRVDKPALLYWLQILASSAFGVSEFSARLPSALAALFTVFLCYELARSMFSRTTGLLSAVALVTSPMICGAARFANPDALLNACTVLTLALFWLGLENRRWWWFVSLGAAMGLAVLAKGPVGLVLPGAVGVLFLMWERRLNITWDRRWFLASSTFFLVALPWYAWVGVETKGTFLVGFLWNHNVNRGLSAMENHGGFPGYYLVVLLAGTAPWSIFLLASWWYAFWSAIRQPSPRFASWWSNAAEDVTSAAPLAIDGITPTPTRDAPAAYRLLVCWIFVYCLFFSVAATKLPNYVLPVIVPSAILIGRFLQRWRTGLLHLPQWFVFAGLLAMGFVGVAIAVGASVAGGAIEWSILRGRSVPGVASWAWMGLVPLAAALLGWWLIRTRRIGGYITTVAVTAVVLLAPLAVYGSMFFNEFKAPRPLVEQARALQREEDLHVGCWQVEYLPSLNFYLQRDVRHFGEEKELAPFLRSPTRVFLFIPAKDWQRLEPSLSGLARVVARHGDLYRHHEIVVVTNR